MATYQRIKVGTILKPILEFLPTGYYGQIVYNGYHKFYNFILNDSYNDEILMKLTDLGNPINTFISWGFSKNPIEGRIKGSQVDLIPFFVIDIDKFKLTKAQENVFISLTQESMKYQPHMIVNTNGGYHLWYKINTSIEDFPYLVEEIQNDTRFLLDEFFPNENHKVDEVVKNIGRIIRLPFSYKYKSDDNRGFVKVIFKQDTINAIDYKAPKKIFATEYKKSKDKKQRKVKKTNIKLKRYNISNLTREEFFFVLRSMRNSTLKYNDFRETIKRINDKIGEKIIVQDGNKILKHRSGYYYQSFAVEFLIKDLYRKITQRLLGRNIQCILHDDKKESAIYNENTYTFYCNAGCTKKPMPYYEYFLRYAYKTQNKLLYYKLFNEYKDYIPNLKNDFIEFHGELYYMKRTSIEKLYKLKLSMKYRSATIEKIDDETFIYKERGIEVKGDKTKILRLIRKKYKTNFRGIPVRDILFPK